MSLLKVLKAQKGFKDIEIIIVDSGSTDRTLDFAKRFNAKVIQIKPEEFSHSYARNLGAKHASGDFLLFTVQDALPPSETWLHEMFTVLSDNQVAAVSCAETPEKMLIFSTGKFVGTITTFLKFKTQTASLACLRCKITLV